MLRYDTKILRERAGVRDHSAPPRLLPPQHAGNTSRPGGVGCQRTAAERPRRPPMAKPGRNRPATAKEDNRLLAALDGSERKRLQPQLEPVTLGYGEVLFEPRQEITHAYFVRRGVVAAVRDLGRGDGIAVASVGSEGMIGTSLVLGERTTASRALVHIAGSALRIEADVLLGALARRPGWRRLLQRYARALLNQVAQTAACNLLHTVDERCAKWLLLTHDRVGRPSFALPRELLAQMLGVRRPAASLAAGMLQRAGAITYIRGHVVVVDRVALEAISCACYWAILAEYQGLLRRAP